MEEEEWRRNKPPEDETVIVTVKDDTADRPYYYTSTGWYFKGLWVVDNAPFLVDRLLLGNLYLNLF